MAVVGGFVGRLPAAVFFLITLIFGGWLLQAVGVKPTDVSTWLGARVLYDFAVLVAIMPLLAGLAFLVGVAAMITHHHYVAMVAGALTLGFIVMDMIWSLTPLGAWATAHFAGI